MLYGGRIEMRSLLSRFWQFQKVCLICFYNDVYKLIFNIIADKKYSDNVKFRQFRRQLFHMSIVRIFRSLEPFMRTPEIVRCPDQHYRRVIYGFGPYIADYPEQVLLTCIVQGWCPR
jgi:hypothetical protein